MSEMFSKRLKELRTEKGENQQAIADLIKVSVQSYSAYESGREPNITNIKKLAKYFDVSVDYLTGYTRNRKPQEVSSEKSYGDSDVERLVSLYAQMSNDALGKARKIDEETIELALKIATTGKRDGSLIGNEMVKEEVYTYLYDNICSMGTDISFCLEQCNLWINVDKNGKISMNEEVFNRLLNRR